MTYPQALEYLESFINYENIPAWPYKQSLKLERFRDFLKSLGNPEGGLRCIHIAGSKGKGSTAAFAAYILKEAGLRVGLYTSPHLADFRERIRILDARSGARDAGCAFEGMISRRDLALQAARLEPFISVFNAGSKNGRLSFFEVYTALAFLYFREQAVDLAVLETGLGGRLDATNTVDPLVCVITPISLEHTQKLGNTIRAIAAEKAGIIKQGFSGAVPVIVAPQLAPAEAVLRQRCGRMRAKLYRVGRDIRYIGQGGSFGITGPLGDYRGLRIGLIGPHQVENAVTAVGAVSALSSCGIKVGPGAVRRGLRRAVWPGRCEIIGKSPRVIVDGAQNRASAAVLKAAIASHFKYRKLILVLGISKDKDIAGICRELGSFADSIVLTQADNPRASAPADLAGHFRGRDVFITASVREARRKAFALAEKNDLILATGSLFVVGEFRGGRI